MNRIYLGLVGLWVALVAMGLALELMAYAGVLEPMLYLLFRMAGIL